MSGHSKWANIKHKKGKADAARGKIFTKIGREIAIAVREGGSDPETNGKLRDVVAKAKVCTSLAPASSAAIMTSSSSMPGLRSTTIRPLRSNIQPTEPVAPRLPPNLSK